MEPVILRGEPQKISGDGSGYGSGSGDGSGYGSKEYWLATIPCFARRGTSLL